MNNVSLWTQSVKKQGSVGGGPEMTDSGPAAVGSKWKECMNEEVTIFQKEGGRPPPFRNCPQITQESCLSKFPLSSLSSVGIARYASFLRLDRENLSRAILLTYLLPVPKPARYCRRAGRKTRRKESKTKNSFPAAGKEFTCTINAKPVKYRRRKFLPRRSRVKQKSPIRQVSWLQLTLPDAFPCSRTVAMPGR